MPKKPTQNASTKKGERLDSQPTMGEDASLDSISAEAAAAALEAEANLAARPTTKTTMGEVDGLVREAGDAAKFQIPSKVVCTKSLKKEEVVVYKGSSKYSGRKSDHKGPLPECESKSS